jgi:predicted nucleotidyltransferase
MNKQDIIDIIRISKPELARKYGVRELGLFGSFLHSQQNEESDIDILVTFSRDVDLFEFIDLREYLEEKLRKKIDLVMRSALKPAIGKRILKEVEYV